MNNNKTITCKKKRELGLLIKLESETSPIIKIKKLKYFIKFKFDGKKIKL